MALSWKGPDPQKKKKNVSFRCCDLKEFSASLFPFSHFWNTRNGITSLQHTWRLQKEIKEERVALTKTTSFKKLFPFFDSEEKKNEIRNTKRLNHFLITVRRSSTGSTALPQPRQRQLPLLLLQQQQLQQQQKRQQRSSGLPPPPPSSSSCFRGGPSLRKPANFRLRRLRLLPRSRSSQRD